MRRPTLATCTAAAAAVLALACRADRADSRPAAETATAGVPVTSTAHDSLTLDLLVPPEVRAGARVRFVLRLANRGSRPRDVYLRGRAITIDIEVARADGAVVWRRLEGEMIPAIVHLRTLAPGERLEIETTWDQRATGGKAVEPGDYVARGLLLLEEASLATAPVAFRVAAR